MKRLLAIALLPMALAVACDSATQDHANMDMTTPTATTTVTAKPSDPNDGVIDDIEYRAITGYLNGSDHPELAKVPQSVMQELADGFCPILATSTTQAQVGTAIAIANQGTGLSDEQAGIAVGVVSAATCLNDANKIFHIQS